MSKTNKNIPELRFSKFVNDGEWAKKNLGSLGSFLGGGTPSKAIEEYWKGEIPWISSSDLFEDDINNISITQFINNTAVKNSATKLIPEGSVLFVSRVGVGKLAINEKELCTSQDFTSFIPYEILNYFVGYYFLANKHLLTSLTQGTSIKGFSKSDLEDLIILYPTNSSEQQKIASCLSSLDELISAEEQRLEQLTEHKKGLMQNLFPQEGETIPKYRFPEFEKDGEWEGKRLGKLSKLISSGKDKNNDNGNFPLYGSTGIIGNVLTPSYEGTLLLIARVGANAGLINKIDGEFGATDNTLIINLLNVEDVDFIYYLLNHFNLNKLVFGSGQPLITGRQLKNLKLLIPTDSKEQQKIASCLSSLDELIQAQTGRIEELKEHKKGLMQKLFPISN